MRRHHTDFGGKGQRSTKRRREFRQSAQKGAWDRLNGRFAPNPAVQPMGAAPRQRTMRLQARQDAAVKVFGCRPSQIAGLRAGRCRADVADAPGNWLAPNCNGSRPQEWATLSAEGIDKRKNPRAVVGSSMFENSRILCNRNMVQLKMQQVFLAFLGARRRASSHRRLACFS